MEYSLFEILRLQYLMAGFWLFLPLLIVGILLLDYTYFFIRTQRAERIKRSYAVLLELSYEALLIGSALILPEIAVFSEMSFRGLISYLTFPIFIFIMGVIAISISFSRQRSKPASNSFASGSVTKSLALLIFLLTGTAVYVAFETYPQISRSLGGGMPVRVEVRTRNLIHLVTIAY